MPSIEQLQHEHSTLQTNYDLLSEKLRRLHKAHVIESKVSVLFEIEEEIKQAEKERNEFEQKLATLEKQIEQARHQHTQPTPSPDEESDDPLKQIQVFNTGMFEIDLLVSDQNGQLWVSDGQQVKIFQLRNSEPIDAWLLPGKIYKYFLPEIWKKHLLCSDWDGNLLMFNEQTRGEGRVLHQAKYSDLPIHCLRVGEQEQLAAGTWDGKILTWDPDGYPVLSSNPVTVPYLATHLIPSRRIESTSTHSPISISYLPTHLFPLTNNQLAVVDQASYMRLFNAEGEENLSWQIDGAVQDVWVYENHNHQPIFLALVNDHRIIEVKSERPREMQSIELDGPVVSLSHRRSASTDQWTVIAMTDGRIDWLSWSPFRIIPNNRVKVDFEVQQIIAVFDPQRPSALVALGLTAEGQLFLINGQDVELFSTPVIEQIALDPSGRFLFWLSEGRIEVYRNPAILPASCQVKFVSVDGELTVGAFNEIRVLLENSGTIPIYKIRGWLRGENRIDPRSSEYQARTLPGELIELKFAVRAIAAGSAVPVELVIELEDEAGPPITRKEFNFTVESKEG